MKLIESDSVGATIVSVSGNEITLDFGSDLEVIQPGAILEYEYPSILSIKARPTIKEIVSRSGNQVTVRTNQSTANALALINSKLKPPAAFTVKIWNQA